MASQVSGTIEKINIGGTSHAIASTAYGYCTTLSGTPAKTVEMTGFQLLPGVTVFIKFQYTNTGSNPTLKIENTDAKPIIMYNGFGAGITPETSWYDGSVVMFTYDGEHWILNNGIGQDTKIEIIRL